MSYFIRMDDGSKIDLPQELNVEERISLCEEILEKYSDNFEVGLKNRSYRLEIMGSYIIDGDKKSKEYPTLTTYRHKRNKNKEKIFSELEQKYDKNNEFY